jgi:putative redox protein
MKIETVYQGGMRFAAEGPVSTIMDAAVEVGGKGLAPTPKQLVLHGLAGCTGMDVAAILAKRKVSYDHFSIDVEAEQTEHHPKVFKHIKVTFRFTADPADRSKIERAITLSRENFCGVSAMLDKSATIETELILTPTT